MVKDFKQFANSLPIKCHQRCLVSCCTSLRMCAFLKVVPMLFEKQVPATLVIYGHQWAKPLGWYTPLRTIKHFST